MEFLSLVVDTACKHLQISPGSAKEVLHFIQQALLRGPRFSKDALQALSQLLCRKLPDSARADLLQIIDQQVSFVPKRIDGWPSNMMIDIADEPAKSVAIALTGIVTAPFYNLRPDDFTAKSNDLSDLTLRYQTVALFVSLSLMIACAEGLDRVVRLAAQWIRIGTILVKDLHNFHMALAVHAGLSKHCVDRLKPIWEALPNAAAKEKEHLDQLCDVTTRMKGLLDLQERAKTKKIPVIPSIFWLVQKTELLHETPTHLESGSLNSQFFLSAGKIFGDLADMQSIRHSPPGVREDLLCFFFLELEKKQDQIGEEALHEMSCHAKEKLAAFQPSTTPKTRSLNRKSLPRSKSSDSDAPPPREAEGLARSRSLTNPVDWFRARKNSDSSSESSEAAAESMPKSTFPRPRRLSRRGSSRQTSSEDVLLASPQMPKQ